MRLSVKAIGGISLKPSFVQTRVSRLTFLTCFGGASAFLGSVMKNGDVMNIIDLLIPDVQLQFAFNLREHVPRD